MRLARSILLAAAALAVAAGPAAASMPLTDTNITGITLEVDSSGEALVSYVRANGEPRHVLLWGAVNALTPGSGVPQVHFERDYAGGWGEYHDASYWKTFRNACRPYSGPALPYFVVGCTAPDGSYWAIQSWQRGLPHRGYPPWTPAQSAWSFDVSHWSGPIADVQLYDDWPFNGETVGIFGNLSYDGAPVHGFSTTATGVPKDGYGRMLYIDTYDSAYGAGWQRETSIDFRDPVGDFCYSFWPTNDPTLPGAPSRPAGTGSEYRISVIGPGVTPDVSAEVAGLGPYDPSNAQDVAYEQSQLALFDQITAGDKFCPTQR